MTTDSIEPQIRPLVDALNETGLVRTFSSCEGHYAPSEQTLVDRNHAEVRFVLATGVSLIQVEALITYILTRFKARYGLIPMHAVGYKLYTPLDEESVEETFVLKLRPFNRFDPPERKRDDTDRAITQISLLIHFLTSLAMNWNSDSYTEKHAFVYQYGTGLLDLLNPQPGERILDLGCGSGELTQRIAERGAQVVGIDSSADMLAKAQNQFPDLDLRQMDATDFAFPYSFDAIFSNAVLHWVLDYEAVVRQIAVALKPGGRLVIEFGGRHNVASITEAVTRELQAAGHTVTPFWFFPSIGEYTPVLERHGLAVRLAQHYDRDTLLSDPETGLTDWLEQFGTYFFEGVDAATKAEVLEKVNVSLRPTLFRDGRWYADYKRLRIVAERVA